VRLRNAKSSFSEFISLPLPSLSLSLSLSLPLCLSLPSFVETTILGRKIRAQIRESESETENESESESERERERETVKESVINTSARRS
jgi:hypothetical protein